MLFIDIVNSQMDMLILTIMSLSKPRILDLCMSTVEWIILIPAVTDVLHIIRVKTSISLKISNQYVWMAYCIFTSYYFYSFDQYMTLYANLAWVLYYFIKILVCYKYKTT